MKTITKIECKRLRDFIKSYDILMNDKNMTQSAKKICEGTLFLFVILAHLTLVVDDYNRLRIDPRSVRGQNGH